MGFCLINLLCDTKYTYEVEENRKILASIIDINYYVGKPWFTFIIQREYSISGFGNFVEFLQFRLRVGDKVLQQHFKNCSENAIKVMFQKLHRMVWLADKASDCSNQEKLSLVLRYVDSDRVIREEFSGF